MMAKEKNPRKKKLDGSKTIRVNREVANSVSKLCSTTGVPIATFFTLAAKEKLERELVTS